MANKQTETRIEKKECEEWKNNPEIMKWREKTVSCRNEALYKATSIPNIIELYTEELMKSDHLYDLVHAEALRRYYYEIIDKKYLHQIRTYFNKVFSLISKNDPESYFRIIGRRKSFISTDNKFLDIISEIRMKDEAEQSIEFTKLLKELKSKSLIKDTYGFRIILFDNNQEKLYKVKDYVVEYLKQQNCQILTIKDRVKKPKTNGYQTIHVFLKSKEGRLFELQFRTFEMEISAESGKAAHSLYKPNDNSFDRSKVKIPGYAFTNNNEFDYIGIKTALEIMRRQKVHISE